MAEQIYILPYIRKGLSNFIKNENPEAGQVRATMDLNVTLQGTTPTGEKKDEGFYKSVTLVGPSDVKQVNKDAISLVYPPNTNTQRFNASFMPFMEFYEEDFPWRYTPMATEQEGFCLWVVLVAVTTDEYTTRFTGAGKKAVTFNLSDERYAEVFPTPTDFQNLAHVQLITDSDEIDENNGPQKSRCMTGWRTIQMQEYQD